MSIKNAVEIREKHIKALEKSLLDKKLKNKEKKQIESLIKILEKEIKELEGK